MYTPEQKTFYVMDMLDYSDYRPGTEMSLDRLVTETYGRKYEGQQTGDMLSNDTYHLYVMNDENYVMEWVTNDENFDFYEEPRPPGYPAPDYPRGMMSLKRWLAQPDHPEYDFMHIRLAPDPRTMLAYLIRDGHLPYGTYLMRVSW